MAAAAAIDPAAIAREKNERRSTQATRYTQRAEVWATIIPARRCVQIEGKQRAPIVVRHLDKNRPRGLFLAAFKRREPIDGRHASGISDADLRDGILESQTRSLAGPDEDFRIDGRHRSIGRVTPGLGSRALSDP